MHEGLLKWTSQSCSTPINNHDVWMELIPAYIGAMSNKTVLSRWNECQIHVHNSSKRWWSKQLISPRTPGAAAISFEVQRTIVTVAVLKSRLSYYKSIPQGARLCFTTTRLTLNVHTNIINECNLKIIHALRWINSYAV